jgi:hypothetical protein
MMRCCGVRLGYKKSQMARHTKGAFGWAGRLATPARATHHARRFARSRGFVKAVHSAYNWNGITVRDEIQRRL